MDSGNWIGGWGNQSLIHQFVHNMKSKNGTSNLPALKWTLGAGAKASKRNM